MTMKKILLATALTALTSTAALAGWYYTAHVDGTSPSSWPAACDNAVSKLKSRYPNVINVYTRNTGYDTYNLVYHCSAYGQYYK